MFQSTPPQHQPTAPQRQDNRGHRDTDLPALVLGRSLTTLGPIRSLGRVGVPVYVTCDDESIAIRSRWARPVSATISDLSDHVALEAFLRSVPVRRAVLFPCSDALALAAARLPEDLQSAFVPVASSPRALDAVVDKGRFAQLLRSHNLPSPQTHILSSPSDIEKIPGGELPRFFLKPHSSQQFSSHFGVKAFRLNGRADAYRRYEAIREAGLDALLQEYIPGPPSDHYYIDGFVDRSGQSIARFARQRLRMRSSFANSSYMRSVPLTELGDASRSVATLIEALGLRGMYSVELKRDLRDGAFRIIEVNARAWLNMEFAQVCGVNICALAYQDALGRKPASVADYRIRARWFDFQHDLPECLRLVRRAELSLYAWLRSWAGAREICVAPDDPAPGLARLGRMAAEWARSRARGRTRSTV